MMISRTSVAALAVMTALGGCTTTTYASVDREGEDVYLAGTTATSFLFFTTADSWVRRCAESDQGLACRELAVHEPEAKAASEAEPPGGTTTPAATPGPASDDDDDDE